MAEANRLSQMLGQVLGADRFPVKVKELALEYSANCFPDSPIAKVDSISLPGFEGMLKANRDRSKWMILYNDATQSEGRIRFTLAHELGHYVLHRTRQDEFTCSELDMNDWDSNIREMESEADTFASYLLMPLDDFRAQTSGQPVSIDLLRHCASRYGVSLMAAALKWTEIAPKRMVVVAARDDYLLWARSNRGAFRSGTFLATRKRPIEVPMGSLVRTDSFAKSGEVRATKARLWFPAEPADMPLTEMVFVSEHYDYTLGLLLLPEAERAFDDEDDDAVLMPIDRMMKNEQA